MDARCLPWSLPTLSAVSWAENSGGWVFQQCGWQVFLGGHLSEDLQGEMGHVDDGRRERGPGMPNEGQQVLASHC